MNENRFPMLMLAICVFILSFMVQAHRRQMKNRLSRIEAKQDAVLQTLRIVGVRLPEETE